MNIFLKLAIGILAVIGAAYIGLMVFVGFSTDCHRKAQVAISSPDGSANAKYGIEHCDSMAGEIYIYLKFEGEDSSTKIFKALPTTTRPIEMTWVSESELLVEYPQSLKVETQLRSAKDITITYTAYD